MAYYQHPNYQSKKSSGATSPVIWNWSSPPQAPARSGDWASPLLDYSQPEIRDWATPPPPHAYQQNTSYAGNMRMVSNNGYGFHGDLVRPRHVYQQPPLTSTPRPDLYPNPQNWQSQGNSGVPTQDHGLTEVLASYATRKSTVVFMDSKAKGSRGLWTSKSRILLLIFLIVICIATASFLRSFVNIEKRSMPNRPILPSPMPLKKVEVDDKPSIPVAVSIQEPVEPTLPAVKNNTITIDPQPQPPVPATSYRPMTPSEMDQNIIIKQRESEQSPEIITPSPQIILKEDPKLTVTYTFDDDDKDLANEARVETVIEREVIVQTEKVKSKNADAKPKAHPNLNKKNDAKPKAPPPHQQQRRGYAYPGPKPGSNKPGNRPLVTAKNQGKAGINSKDGMAWMTRRKHFQGTSLKIHYLLLSHCLRIP